MAFQICLNISRVLGTLSCSVTLAHSTQGGHAAAGAVVFWQPLLR